MAQKERSRALLTEWIAPVLPGACIAGSVGDAPPFVGLLLPPPLIPVGTGEPGAEPGREPVPVGALPEPVEVVVVMSCPPLPEEAETEDETDREDREV